MTWSTYYAAVKGKLEWRSLQASRENCSNEDEEDKSSESSDDDDDDDESEEENQGVEEANMFDRLPRAEL